VGRVQLNKELPERVKRLWDKMEEEQQDADTTVALSLFGV